MQSIKESDEKAALRKQQIRAAQKQKHKHKKSGGRR